MKSIKYWYMFTCVKFLQPYVHPNNIKKFSSLPTENTLLSFWTTSYSCLGKYPVVFLKYGLGKISYQSQNNNYVLLWLTPILPIDITGVYSQNCHTAWTEREIFTVRSGGIKSPAPYFSGLKKWNHILSLLPFLQFVYSPHYVMIRVTIAVKQCFLHS